MIHFGFITKNYNPVTDKVFEDCKPILNKIFTNTLKIEKKEYEEIFNEVVPIAKKWMPTVINVTTCIGYIPIIGRIQGIFSIALTLIMIAKTKTINLDNVIVVGKGVVQVAGYSFLLAVPDILVTLGRELSYYHGSKNLVSDTNTK